MHCHLLSLNLRHRKPSIKASLEKSGKFKTEERCRLFQISQLIFTLALAWFKCCMMLPHLRHRDVIFKKFSFLAWPATEFSVHSGNRGDNSNKCKCAFYRCNLAFYKCNLAF